LVNALLALQFGNDSQFIRRNFALFFHDESRVISEEHNSNFIELIIVYLLKKSEFSASETKQLLETISNPVKDYVMTSYYNLIAFGKIKGIEEGRAEGKAEGIAEGKAEGITKAKYEVVKKAHLKGYPVEEIADLVGMPIQRVMEMIKEINSRHNN
jgi:predicted transposase YdaD